MAAEDVVNLCVCRDVSRANPYAGYISLSVCLCSPTQNSRQSDLSAEAFSPSRMSLFHEHNPQQDHAREDLFIIKKQMMNHICIHKCSNSQTLLKRKWCSRTMGPSKMDK